MKTFCPLPWIHSCITLDGRYQLCCTSEEFDNSVRNEQGEPLNVSDNLNLDQVVNSSFMKTTRLEMLKGKWPRACTRCKTTEKMLGSSRRNIENKQYQSIKEELIKNTDPRTGKIEKVNILSSDYRLGNHCNLQCRMCYPGASKKWIKDWNNIRTEKKFSKERLNFLLKDKWYESDFVIKDVQRKVNSIKHLHFAGGEPLISLRMKDILQTIIDHNRSKEVILTYNTNISTLPKAVLDLWPKFKEVRLLVSIDAYGKLNEYIRQPSKWGETEKNLKYLDIYHKELNISQIMLNTTVQLYNILKLKELCFFLQDFKNTVKVPNFIAIYDPEYFQVNHLPEELKLIAQKDLNFIYKKNILSIPQNLKYLLDNIIQIKNFLRLKGSNASLERFREVTLKQDDIYGLRHQHYIPELKSIL